MGGNPVQIVMKVETLRGDQMEPGTVARQQFQLLSRLRQKGHKFQANLGSLTK